MIRRAANWVPIILLGSVATVSTWLLQSAQDRPVQVRKANTGIDGWAENFTIRRFGTDGKLQHILSGKRLEHEQGQDSTFIVAPKVSVLKSPGMSVLANEAFLTSEAESVLLKGNVKLDRGAKARAGSMQLRANQVTLYPDRQLAESSSGVQIVQGLNRATAASVRVDGRTGLSILQGGVRATINQKAN